MAQVMTRDGFNAMSSKNLDSIMRYHREKSPMVYVRITERRHNDGCSVYIQYLNDSYCEEEFRSYELCKLWFKRKRSIYATIDHIDSETHDQRSRWEDENDEEQAKIDYLYNINNV
jgi:hypothetical protein